MAIDHATLATRIAKAAHALNTLNTARLTTVPAEVEDYTDEFSTQDLTEQAVVKGLADAVTSYQTSGDGLAAALKASVGRLVVKTVNDDQQQPDNRSRTALEEWRRQLIDDSESFDASTIGVSITAGSRNVGDGVIVSSTKRGDGLVNEFALAETLFLEVSDTAASGSTFSVEGEPAVTNKLSHLWPAGSGARLSLATVSPASSLLSNGDFEDEETTTNAPDDWVVAVGTIGTTIKLTDVEVQQIAVTGSPSAGTYEINWTNQDGQALTTSPLAYDASGAQVQAALRALPGLELIEVETSGTTPNFTHVITFRGVGGNLNQVTVTNRTTGGTFTPSTTTSGSAHVYSGGKALEFDSDGSQLTEIRQVVTGLRPFDQLAVNLWMKTDSPPAAGVITISLYDGNATINDEAGTTNAFTVDCTALTTSYVAKNGVFRLPAVVPDVVYLRIKITTAVSNTSSIFLDRCALARMTRLYVGGPSLCAFSGTNAFSIEDTFEVAVTNDRGGALHEAINRFCDLRDADILLPTDSGGSETISDSLIA